MKKSILICLYMTFVFLAFSQETNDITKVHRLTKGKLVLIDGTAINFKQLMVLNDSVILINLNSITSKYSSEEVYKISRIGNHAAVGAITSGLGAILGGVAVTYNWNMNSEHRNKKIPVIVGATIVGAAIGGIVGAFMEKNKLIYKNQKAFSFGMDYNMTIEDKPNVLLTCKINF